MKHIRGVGFRPYPATLDYDGKHARDKHSSILGQLIGPRYIGSPWAIF
jgi:hypothetical protein